MSAAGFTICTIGSETPCSLTAAVVRMQVAWQRGHLSSGGPSDHRQRSSDIRDPQKGITMKIEKSKIVEMLRSRGDNALAPQADKQLPPQIDTDQHMEQLSKLGINPQELTKLAGGLLGH